MLQTTKPTILPLFCNTQLPKVGKTNSWGSPTWSPW